MSLDLLVVPGVGKTGLPNEEKVREIRTIPLARSGARTANDTLVVRFRKFQYFFQFDDASTLIGEIRLNVASANDLGISDHLMGQSATGKSAKSLQSDELMIPYPMVQGLSRFDAQVSRDQFDGAVILNRPSGALALSLSYLPGWEWMNREFLIATEDNFNKSTVYGNRKNTSERPWIRDFCNYCTAFHDFGRLTGVAWVDNLWLVAGGPDGIVHGLSYDGFWNFDSVLTINDSLGFVSDVAGARIPISDNYLADLLYIAVAYRDQDRIGIYDTDGTPVSMLLGPGDGYNQIKTPTAVCFARSWVTSQKMPYFYAIDNGNKRIVMKGLLAPYAFFTSEASHTFDPEAWLVSITTDIFGSVYVLDEFDGRIYMFSNNLDTLLATYGSLGSGVNQLNYPKAISAAELWTETSDTSRMEPGIVGNVVATEFVTNTTGVRSFVLGGHVSSHDVYYVPKYYEWGNDYVRLDWEQSFTSSSRRRVYFGNTLLEDITNPINLPGQHYHEYLMLSDTLPDGWYRFVINITSIYNANDTTLVDSVYVERSVLAAQRIRVDTLAAHDITGRLPTSCAYVGYDWWKAGISARDQWFDSTLTYVWYSHHCRFAEDTADTGNQDNLLITQHDSVFVMFTSVPAANKSPDDLSPQNNVFIVMFADTDRPDTIEIAKPWEPPDSGYQFIDTVGFNGVTIHEDSCATSCIYCPPCCVGMTGNVDMDPNDNVTMSDLTVLTNHLYVTYEPLPCPEEANTSGDPEGMINSTDHILLVNHLFVTFEPLAQCVGSKKAPKGGTK